MPHSKRSRVCALVFASQLAIACTSASNPVSPNPEPASDDALRDLDQELRQRRGSLRAARHRRSLSAEQIVTQLAAEDFDAGAVQYGVDLYS